MPELPEVETVARSISAHVNNCVIGSSVLLYPKTLHPLSLPLSTLDGFSVKNVRRRGKLLVFDLNPGSENLNSETVPEYLIIHLRMTGRLLTQAANADLGKHTRCVWNMLKPDGTPFQLFFDDTRTFGKVFAANQNLLNKWDFWRDLGPEPLAINPQDFLARLKGARAIKSSLLDQSVIAGIGNIYADESLFRAGINPARPASSLNEADSSRLLFAIQEILNLAIENKGSSIRDYRDADGNEGSFQNNFFVYGRGDQPCLKCGTQLQKRRINGRATVYCPLCQK